MRFAAGALLLAGICTAALTAGPKGPALRTTQTVRRPGPFGPGGEVRALWVQRATLTSAPSVVALVETARAAGFNTLLVQVRGRGDAYYNSRLEPRGPALAGQHPSFDPLELVIATAHLAGLRVHAWINVNL